MSVDRHGRLMAGFFVMQRVLLAHFPSPWWLSFTGFVGLNVFRSAFTNGCPATAILRKSGVSD